MISTTNDRRLFLRGAAETGSATVVRAQEDPLRLGMIGVGKRGNTHLGEDPAEELCQASGRVRMAGERSRLGVRDV